jgi:hypothetical protein
MNKTMPLVVLLLCFGSVSFAEEPQSAMVTVRGILHEDKHGFFFQIEGTVYDIAVNDANKFDVHKFYTSLEGDMVTVSGVLHVQEVKGGKPYLVVATNEIARLKGERVRVEVERRPVVREYYVDRRPGIDLPLVHIRW